jgi:Icc-related predicted phosphoesterase
MKILHVSDLHGFHKMLHIPKDIDLLIVSGDVTNSKNRVENDVEFERFYKWWYKIETPKIIIAGNHDNCFLKQYNKDKIKECSIYLEHEYWEYKGLLIFASPYIPTYGNWDFMIASHKISRYWDELSEDIDILITHGPPKTILDLSYNRQRNLEFCGDSALLKRIKKVNPRYHLFGHIHDNQNISNYGLRTVDYLDTKFYNSACVKDAYFNLGLIHQGQIINI